MPSYKKYLKTLEESKKRYSMTIKELGDIRFQFLKRLYELTEGNRYKLVNRYQIGDEFQIDRDLTDNIVYYLRGQGFIGGGTLDGKIGISHEGIVEVEESLSELNGSTVSESEEFKEDKEWDLFICHASEDKGEIADSLAKELRKELKVWYDDFILTIGDSLRQKIDEGLTKSRYGVVIISPAFFQKQWTRIELDGLAARATIEKRKVLLPIWHKVNKEDVAKYSPMLAGLVAAHSSRGIAHVVEEIMKVVRQ